MGSWDLVKVWRGTYWGFHNVSSLALSWDWIETSSFGLFSQWQRHYYTTWPKVHICSLFAIITSWDKVLTQSCHLRGANRVQKGALWQKIESHTECQRGLFDTKMSHVVPIQTFRCLDVSVDQLWLSRWPRAYQGVGYNWDITGFMIDTNDDKTWSHLLSPWLSWRVASRSFRVASSSSTFGFHNWNRGLWNCEYS